MLPRMTDAFADVVMPMFQKVLQLLDQLYLGEARTPDEVVAQTRSWIEEAARKTVAKPDLARSFELAKFGLVTRIDKILTDSARGANARWSAGVHLLEWSIYGTRVGASRFYEEAKSAEDEGDLDALEVYLLCVTLGFKGGSTGIPGCYKQADQCPQQRLATPPDIVNELEEPQVNRQLLL